MNNPQENRYTTTIRHLFHRRQRLDFEMQEPTPLANTTNSNEPIPPQVFVGTIVQINMGENLICYKIRPDLVNGRQPHDEHGFYNSHELIPIGARVAFRHEPPGIETIFPEAVTIIDVWWDAL